MRGERSERTSDTHGRALTQPLTIDVSACPPFLGQFVAARLFGCETGLPETAQFTQDTSSLSRGLRIGRSTRKHRLVHIKGSRVSPTMVPRAPLSDHNPPLHEVVNAGPTAGTEAFSLTRN